jgi:hypothetical protein
MTLYKYLVPDRADILERELVRFTHPSALNDLTELRPRFSRLLTMDQVLQGIDLERIASEAYKRSSELVHQAFSPSASRQFVLDKLASEEGQRVIGTGLSIINDFAPQLRDTMYKSLDQLIGVFSLSEAWDNGPMWAHYADLHRGFLLGFDDTNSYFHRQRTEQDICYHLRQVLYADLPSGPRSFDEQSFGPEVFLTKDKSWSYEREWRMLAPLSGAAEVLGSQDDPVHLFQLPGAVIKSVIIGARASYELKTRLTSVLDSKSSFAHVKLYQAQTDDGGGLRLLPVREIK